MNDFKIIADLKNKLSREAFEKYTKVLNLVKKLD